MALLEINQIRKTYATGEVALRGVDISLNSEEIVAVLGLSGSGKSTLLRCINRLVEPDSGTVTLVLCALYNLSDDQVEYQLRDRLSFMRFLGLGLEDRVPDAKTVWLYREHLAQAGVIEALFDAFDGSLKKRGYLAMGGQIIDASIVPVPQQRNSRDENARIKDGETPEGWEKQPAKRRQKDTDARWTKKHGKSHYGYKNHVNVDRRHKLVRRYQVTDAAVHDSQVVEDILDADNTASDVWADSAYRSAEIEAKLGEKGLKSRIHRKGIATSR